MASSQIQPTIKWTRTTRSLVVEAIIRGWRCHSRLELPRDPEHVQNSTIHVPSPTGSEFGTIPLAFLLSREGLIASDESSSTPKNIFMKVLEGIAIQ
ncbi:hypothetical protein OG21DRAFT_446433 [Imleria badia]|nr:hypothetical protein OG21DRAFT_446433 [Imleria badia]